jgi:hypothetical protein
MFNVWNQSRQVMGLRGSKEKRRRGLNFLSSEARRSEVKLF